MTTRRCMANGNKSKSGIGRLGMLTLPRCWHWLTISFILSMLTQHHGNGFAGKRSVTQVWRTKYGVYRRKEKAEVWDDPMLGQQWSPCYAAGPEFSWIATKGSSWLPYCSWSTLVLSALLHGDASIWIGCHVWQLGRKMLRVVLFLWAVWLRCWFCFLFGGWVCSCWFC